MAGSVGVGTVWRLRLLCPVNQSAQGQWCRLKMYFDLPHVAFKSWLSLPIYFLAPAWVGSRLADSERRFFFFSFPFLLPAMAPRNLGRIFKNLDVTDFPTFKIRKRAKKKKNYSINAISEPNHKPRVQHFEMYVRSLKLRASCLCRPSSRFYVCDRTSQGALKKSLSKSGGKVLLCFIN